MRAHSVCAPIQKERGGLQKCVLLSLIASLVNVIDIHLSVLSLFRVRPVRSVTAKVGGSESSQHDLSAFRALHLPQT